MNTLHPLFAAILHDIEQQPLILHRAALKADARRFTGDPVTGHGIFSEERMREIGDEERTDHLRDDQREAMFGPEDE